MSRFLWFTVYIRLIRNIYIESSR